MSETEQTTEQQELPAADPRMVAFTEWTATAEYDNAFQWANEEEYRKGQLWVAFLAGWNACGPSLQADLQAKFEKHMEEHVEEGRKKTMRGVIAMSSLSGMRADPNTCVQNHELVAAEALADADALIKALDSQ